MILNDRTEYHFTEDANVGDTGIAALALSSEIDEGLGGRRGTQISTGLASDGIVDTAPPIETDLNVEDDTFFEKELVSPVRLLHPTLL